MEKVQQDTGKKESKMLCERFSRELRDNHSSDFHFTFVIIFFLEKIERIKTHVDNMQANVAKADKLMKGIESLPYYMLGKSTKNSLRTKRQENLEEKSVRGFFSGKE